MQFWKLCFLLVILRNVFDSWLSVWLFSGEIKVILAIKCSAIAIECWHRISCSIHLQAAGSFRFCVKIALAQNMLFTMDLHTMAMFSLIFTLKMKSDVIEVTWITHLLEIRFEPRKKFSIMDKLKAHGV